MFSALMLTYQEGRNCEPKVEAQLLNYILMEGLSLCNKISQISHPDDVKCPKTILIFSLSSDASTLRGLAVPIILFAAAPQV